MRPHSIILKTVLSVTTFLMPASAQDSGPYPAIDPATDMIEGQADAPVTLLTYVSPACIHCINLMDELSSGALLQFINSGDLRIVVRQVPTGMPPAPEGATDEVIANALRLSNLISIASKCVYEQSSMSVLINWKYIHLYTRGGAARDDSGVANWPYLDTRQLQEFFQWFWTQERVESQQELAACIDDPAVRRSLFAEVIQAEDEFLAVAPDGWNLPVVILDGQTIDWNGANTTEGRLTLESAVQAAVSAAQNSPSVSAYEQCRREEFVKTYWRMSPEDVPAMIDGINDPSARPSGLPTSRSYWLEVSDIWGLTEYACARYK